MNDGSSFGPRPAVLDRYEARVQLNQMAMRLLLRVRRLDVTLAYETNHEAERVARTLELMLASEQRHARSEAAKAVCEGLADIGELTAPEWWGSDLGRIVAREIGYYTSYVPRRVAQEVLQVTRQAVAQMISRGDLEPVPGEDRAVSSGSLALAAQQRWPRDDDGA